MTERVPTSGQLSRWLPDCAALAVTMVLLWPLLTTSGYPVARDLVFTPHMPLRPETLGVGSGSPRAAPLDAVVSVASTVIDGALLAKVLVALPLVLAGCGAHRLMRDWGLSARLTVAILAVWNPFVVERLGLGQWALLFGYAAVIHTFRVALQQAQSPSDPSHPRSALRPSALAPWMGLGAITPSGALLVAVSSLVMWRQRAGRVSLAALALAVQIPWALPALLGGASATSDPAAVAAFAARSERWGGELWSLIGLGGIWDSLSVPGSRGGWLGHLTSLAVLLVLMVGWASRRIDVRVWFLGLTSLLVAWSSSTAPGQPILEWSVESVPGAGLLRDSQKWLVPFVVLVLLCAGLATDRLVRAAADRVPALALTTAILCPLLPLVTLPDGAVVVHHVVRPVHYPQDYVEVAEAVDGTEGLLIGLPWQLYRAYDWSGAYSAYDPSSRWFNTPVTTPDTLVLGDRTVQGEDLLAERLSGPALEGDVRALHDLGVRFLLLHTGTDDPAVARVLATPDLVVRYAGEWLTLIDLGAEHEDPARPSDHPGRGWSTSAIFVLGADLAVLLVLLGASARNVLRSSRRSATLR